MYLVLLLLYRIGDFLEYVAALYVISVYTSQACVIVWTLFFQPK